MSTVIFEVEESESPPNINIPPTDVPPPVALGEVASFQLSLAQLEAQLAEEEEAFSQTKEAAQNNLVRLKTRRAKLQRLLSLLRTIPAIKHQEGASELTASPSPPSSPAFPSSSSSSSLPSSPSHLSLTPSSPMTTCTSSEEAMLGPLISVSPPGSSTSFSSPSASLSSCSASSTSSASSRCLAVMSARIATPPTENTPPSPSTPSSSRSPSPVFTEPATSGANNIPRSYSASPPAHTLEQIVRSSSTHSYGSPDEEFVIPSLPLSSITHDLNPFETPKKKKKKRSRKSYLLVKGEKTIWRRSTAVTMDSLKDQDGDVQEPNGTQTPGRPDILAHYLGGEPTAKVLDFGPDSSKGSGLAVSLPSQKSSSYVAPSFRRGETAGFFTSRLPSTEQEFHIQDVAPLGSRTTHTISRSSKKQGLWKSFLPSLRRAGSSSSNSGGSESGSSSSSTTKEQKPVGTTLQCSSETFGGTGTSMTLPAQPSLPLTVPGPGSPPIPSSSPTPRFKSRASTAFETLQQRGRIFDASSLGQGLSMQYLELSCEFLTTYGQQPDSKMFEELPDPHALRAFRKTIETQLSSLLGLGPEALPCVVVAMCRFFHGLLFPLLTTSALSLAVWSSFLQIEDVDFQHFCLRSAINSLPAAHQQAAKHLFTTLQEICRARPDQLSNAAFAFGPSILRDHIDELSGRVTKTNVADVCRVVELLIRHADRLFSTETPRGYQVAPNDAKINVVSLATQDRAIDFLLLQPYCDVDVQFVDTFFLTHPYFISATELLHRLTKIYATLMSNEQNEWNRRLRQRILLLIRRWFEEYIQQLEREPPTFLRILSQLIDIPLPVSSSTTSVTSSPPASPSPAEKSLPPSPPVESVDQKALSDDCDSFCWKCSHSDAQLAQPLSDETADPSLPFIRMYAVRLSESSKSRGRLVRNVSYFYKDSNRGQSHKSLLSLLLSNDAADIAKTLTLIDHSHFKSIPSRDFLSSRFQTPELTPNFCFMVNRFNSVGLWIASEILFHLDTMERVATLALAIQISAACLELRNFNTCFAILAGLNLASISRLRQTWGALSKKDRAQYQKLLELFEMTNNFGAYRSTYIQAALPKVPYLMVIPKDLIAIEDNNPNFVAQDPFDLINFHKMRLLFRSLSDIRRTQQAVYSFSPSPNLHVVLNKIKCLSEDELWERSILVEPREST